MRTCAATGSIPPRAKPRNLAGTSRRAGLAAGAALCLLAAAAAQAGMAPRIAGKAGPVAPLPAPPAAWAKPLDGGPIRALIIAPRHTLQDVESLAARLDLKYSAVALWEATRLGSDPATQADAPESSRAEAVTEQLTKALQEPCDVILLGNCDSAILPEPVLSDLMDRVAAGAGLVVAHLRDTAGGPLRTFIDALEPWVLPEPLREGVAPTGLANWDAGGDFAQAYVHGQGRVIRLNYPGDPPANHFLIQTPFDPLDLDAAVVENTWSLAIHAVCAAARRAHAVRITDIQDAAPAGPAAEEIPPDLPKEYVRSMQDSMAVQPVRPFRLVLSDPAPAPYEVEVRLRRPGSDTSIVCTDATLLPKGATSYAFDMIIGTGTHYLDTWLRTRDGRVVSWFSKEFSLAGWPEFENVQYEKTWVQPNDTLRVAFTIRPVFSQSRQCTAYARAVDPRGRMVAEARQAVTNQGGDVTLELHFTDLIAPLLKVEVFAIEGEPGAISNWELERAPRAYRYVSVRMPKPDLNLDLVAMTPAPAEPGQEWLLRRLAGLGVNCLHAPAGEPALVRTGLLGLQLIPELDRFAAEHAAPGLERQPCLHQPEYRQRTLKALTENTLAHWAGGTRRYSLGGGNVLCRSEENVCQSPDTLRAYSEWLKGSYLTLEALGAAWGRPVNGWEDTRPAPLEAARKAGQFAPWVDFRLFMDETFASFHGDTRAAVRQSDRQGEVGGRFYGEDNPIHGYWWPALCDRLDYVAADWNPLTAEKLRSYRRAEAWTGLALPDMAALPNARWAAWLPWYAVARQTSALWLASPFGSADQATVHAALAPDGAPDPLFATLAAEVRRLRDGTAALLLNAIPDPPTVLIYDSHASRHLNDADPAFAASQQAAQQAWMELLETLHRSWAFIDETRLGQISAPATKAVILPLCRALNDHETQVLADFAARGGALIADITPAGFDGHGAVRTLLPLDKVFGVRRDVGLGAATTGAAAWSAADPPAPAGITGTVTADNTLQVDGSKPQGQAENLPLWIRGPGAPALLLNHVPRPRTAASNRAGQPVEYALVDGFLREVGCLPVVDLAKDAAFDGLIAGYQMDRARMVLFLAHPDAPEQKLQLPFPEKSIVYDVLAGSRVKKPHRTTVKLAPGAAALYALLDQSVDKVVVAPTPLSGAGQRLPLRVAVGTDKGQPGNRLVLLDLLDVSGQPIDGYRRIIHCTGGVGESFVPFALNDPPGKYTVCARDLLSGVEGRVSVQPNLNKGS